MPDNKTIISPSQALLILINACNKTDTLKLDTLKRLYLSGKQNNNDEHLLAMFFKDQILANYEISKDPKVINDDPSRRYFETHLAYETIGNSIDNHTSDKLGTLYVYFDSLLGACNIDAILKQNIMEVLHGNFDPKNASQYLRNQTSLMTMFQEYSDYMSRVTK